MDLSNKLNILADAAKYDASCASSGAKRKRQGQELGNTTGTGICHSYTPDGRCISLLKILLTNYCIYDCLYCVNRVSSDTPRARFTTQEIVDLTIGFYRRNYIEGLFLSSGILKNPDYTAELLIDVARSLRTEHLFAGYIHLKAAPGTDPDLLDEMSRWCDRISANIELPSDKDLLKIAPAKSHAQVESTMHSLRQSLRARKAESPYNKRNRFGASSQSTQMIVGATPASDLEILSKADSLYKHYKLRRVYYSAFSPIPHSDPSLPAKKAPLVREHRLYQADWLQRFYNFKVHEIVSDEAPFLEETIDPKLAWALRNRDFFPVDVNTASKEALLRVPGFGTRTVFRILKSRRFQSLSLFNLEQMRVPLKRAKYFISVKHTNAHSRLLDSTSLRGIFVPPEQQVLKFHQRRTVSNTKMMQFETNFETAYSAMSGQL